MKGRLTGFLVSSVFGYYKRHENSNFFFIFKIQFYKTDGKSTDRNFEIINHKVEGNKSETIIKNLPPFSVISLRIAALNEQYQGDFSQPVKLFFYLQNRFIKKKIIF